MAAIDVQNPRLLVSEMEVGGEVLDLPRGACRDHGRYAAIRLLGPQGRIFPGSTLCALSK